MTLKLAYLSKVETMLDLPDKEPPYADSSSLGSYRVSSWLGVPRRILTSSLNTNYNCNILTKKNSKMILTQTQPTC